jgi:phage tail sheath protein FI
MATTYASPGVYVEEVDRGAKPIEPVGASITAFLGISAEASLKTINPDTGERVPVESVLNKATLVTNWTQYTDTFGGFVSGAFMPDAVYGYFANGGGACYVTSLRTTEEGEVKAIAASVKVPAAKGTSFKATAKTAGPAGNSLSVVISSEKEKGKDTGKFSVTVGGETKSGLSMKKGDGDAYIGNAKFAAVDISDVGATAADPTDGNYGLEGGGVPPLTAVDFIGDPSARTGIGGLEALDDIRIVICPDVMTGYDGSNDAKERVKMVQEAMITHCELLRYRFAVIDTPPGLNAQQAKEWRNYINFDSSYAALYYPWIKIADLSGSGSTTKMVPPSGHVVGVYNRTDSERGVHKAPANEILRGAIDLELKLSRGEQDTLNPIGVNCIRTFPGRGIRIWGARTLSSDGSWRYINVRRLFIVVEASIDLGMQWVVFEPNDQMLWARVRRDVRAFLTTIWSGGALFGLSSDEAFYVKCDEELNPTNIRDLGQLIVEIGICPVKPAEFVIFRISQWAGPNAA